MNTITNITSFAWLVVLFLQSSPLAYGRLGGGGSNYPSTTTSLVVHNNNNNDDDDDDHHQMMMSHHHRSLKNLVNCMDEINYVGKKYRIKVRNSGTNNEENTKYAYMSGEDYRIKTQRVKDFSNPNNLLDGGNAIFELEVHPEYAIDEETGNDIIDPITGKKIFIQNWYFLYNPNKGKYVGRDDEKLRGFSSNPNNRGRFRITTHYDDYTTYGPTEACLDKIVLSTVMLKCTEYNDYDDECTKREDRYFHVKKIDDRLNLVNDNKDADWFTLEEVL